MSDLTDHDRIVIVEQQQKAHGRRYDELRADIKEHHDEDDRQFEKVDRRLDEVVTMIRDSDQKQRVRSAALMVTFIFILVGLLGNLIVLLATRGTP